MSEVIQQVGLKEINSIGITNQRETVILWDKETGRPVYNAILWQDLRTEDICRKLSEYSEYIKENTGLLLHPYFSASKVNWIIENVNGVKKDIERGKVIFGTVDTWILWNLTGGKVHKTEPSNASRTLLFNIKRLEYDDELLKIFRIPKNILPEVNESSSLFGYTDKSITGVEIPITGILGDQQASLFAHGIRELEEVKNTYGTGLFLMLLTGSKPIIPERLLGTVAWVINGKVNYAIEGSVLTGGACIKWLMDRLKLIKQAADTEYLAKSISSNEGVYFVPAFSGLGAPYWDASARGIIIGITGRTRIEHIARAALEAIAYQTRDVIEEMEKETGVKIKILKADGGASQNNFLMQFQADILGIPVERPRHVELTALGAAGIAGIYSGMWKSKEEFIEDTREVELTFSPEMKKEERELYYSKWKDAVKRAMKWSML